MKREQTILNFVLSLSLCAALAAGGCHRVGARVPQESETEARSGEVEPPAVLQGEAELVCNIDAKREGTQKLTLIRGGGIEFDAAVSPLVDGTVELKGPSKGGTYRFTSHLAKPTQGQLSGVGEVVIESLETKVQVEVKNYIQPGGPGTPFSFTSTAISERGVYVEFSGKARARSGERYAFRTNLGAAKSGSGRVEPADSNDNTRLQSKMVIIQAPVSTTVVSRTQVKRVP